MSQVSRVLALLRSRPEGVNTAQLQEKPVLDGGAPILRLAARVLQLREAGFVISSQRQANGTSTYRLVAEPEVERALSETKDPSTNEQADPGSVSYQAAVTRQEDVRSAAPVEPQGLFDPVGFTERGDFRDVAA